VLRPDFIEEGVPYGIFDCYALLWAERHHLHHEIEGVLVVLFVGRFECHHLFDITFLLHVDGVHDPPPKFSELLFYGILTKYLREFHDKDADIGDVFMIL
jgi:hypothetical protein